jgi:pimeloyl-ACP methyl ester carboxylesterase
VNGLSLYYEEHGDGDATPLVMLHGGFGTGDMFGPVLTELAKAAGSSPRTCRGMAGRPTSSGRCGWRRWPTTSPG